MRIHSGQMGETARGVLIVEDRWNDHCSVLPRIILGRKKAVQNESREARWQNVYSINNCFGTGETSSAPPQLSGL